MMSFKLYTNGQTGKSKRYAIMLVANDHGGYIIENGILTKKEALKCQAACHRAFRYAKPQDVLAVQRDLLKICGLHT